MLVLFGNPQTKFNGQRRPTFPMKGYLVIALLAMRFSGHAPRSTVASWIWEDHDNASANTNLRQLLVSIRQFEKAHDVRILNKDRLNLWLAQSFKLTDLGRFLSTEHLGDAKALRRYVFDFRNEFLCGLENAIGEELGRWVQSERQSAFEHFTRCVCEAAARIGGKAGEDALQELLVLSPYDEALFRTYILILAHNDAASRIPQAYKLFSARLMSELQIQPETKTLTLVAQLAPRVIHNATPKQSHTRPDWQRARNSWNRGAPEALITENPNVPADVQVPRLLVLPPEDGPFDIRKTEFALARSLIDDVILSLCRTRELSIFAPHTARHIVGNAHQLKTTYFDADYVFHTRLVPVRGQHEHVRLAFSMIATDSQKVILADETLFRPSTLPDLYDDLVRTVTGKITHEIEQSNLEQFRTAGAATAYTYYLLGREKLQAHDLKSIRAARNALRHALELAPDFYPAQHLFASTLNQEWFLLGRQDRTLLIEARKRALQLAAVDSHAPEGHWELGISSLYLGNIDAAINHFEAARSRAPNHADILADGADALAHNSWHKKAKKQIDKALLLNPLPPERYYWISAASDFMLENYDDALTSISRSTPRHHINRLKAACHAMAGEPEKAAECRDLYMSEYPDFRLKEWSDVIPLTNPHDTKHFLDALHLAGFH